MSWTRRRLVKGLGLAAVPWLGCARAGSETRPPRTADAIDVRLPSMVLGTLDGGPKLYIMEDHGLPLVSMAVLLRAGHRYERPGEEGCAAVASALLMEGMEGGDKAALLDRYAELGARPQTSVGRSHLLLRCVAHRDDAPAALRLMIEHLQRATMSEDAFVRVLRERKESLLAARGLPEVVAGFGLIRGSMGIDPAVAVLADGTPQSLDALTRTRVQDWVTSRLSLDALTFVMTGDVSTQEVSGWVAKALGDLPASAAAAAVPEPEPSASEHPYVVMVPWPALPQALVALGGPRAPWGHEDEPAEFIAGSLMAGIVQYELRSRQRVSYGVQTRSWSTKRDPVAQLWAKVEPDELGRVVRGLWEYLERLEQDVQVSESAIASVRQGAMVGSMHDHHGAEAGMAQLLRLADDGLSAHTAQRRLDRLAELDTAEVTRAMRQMYHPDRVRLCVVGPADALDSARAVLSKRPMVERRPGALFGLSEEDEAAASSGSEKKPRDEPRGDEPVNSESPSTPAGKTPESPSQMPTSPPPSL